MKEFLSFILLVSISLPLNAQGLFRSGIFLHHSTGQNIWGPNGSSTSIPQEMDAYNLGHGFTGTQAVTMNEEWWSPPDNEWVRWHAFFEDPDPVTGIGYYLPGNKIIVIKSCFPSSAIGSPGIPADTLTPESKTVYNYKWHWRHIVKAMQSHPENFFAIWTNAPLEPNSTNPDEAALSAWFCTWAKDTLANGLDPEYGLFPPNVYVFDYFHKLTGPDGMELPMYATGPGDSHPNASATELVAPQFVEEIFDASINYENIYGISPGGGSGANRISASPNPFRTGTVIRFMTAGEGMAELNLFDNNGKKIKGLWSGNHPGEHQLTLTGQSLQNGLFYIQLSDNVNKCAIRIIRVK